MTATAPNPTTGPTAALDANVNPEASILYDAYGAVRYTSATMPTDLGFTGQRSDASTTGLDYYGARYYDPTIGQFTSADPTLLGGTNRYAYVGGNPETLRDPSGHGASLCDISACVGEGDDIGVGFGGGEGDGGSTANGDGNGDSGVNSTTTAANDAPWLSPTDDAGTLLPEGEAEQVQLRVEEEQEARFRTEQQTHEGDPNGPNGASGQGNGQGNGQAPSTEGTTTEANGQGNGGNGNSAAPNSGNPTEAFSDLAQQRVAQGLPEAGAEGDGSTLARLDVNGQSYYGQNGYSRPITLRVNNISIYHAETNAFQAAYDAGEFGGNGILYVDRALCAACGANGAVSSLGMQLGLQTLTVYTLGLGSEFAMFIEYL